MFLFEPLPWYSILMWFVVLGGLILVNELARITNGFRCDLFWPFLQYYPF